MSVERHDIHAEDPAPYVLGALTETEVRRFESHVADCAVCRDEVERLRPAADALPRSVEPVDPPASLKHALMAVIEADLRERDGASETVAAASKSPGILARTRQRLSASGERTGGGRPALAGVSAFVVLFVGVLGGYAATQLTAEAERGRTVAAKVDEARLPSGSGSLVVPASTRDGGVLRVHGLPALDRDSVYQVWVRRGGEMISQSLFSVGQNGEGAAAVADDLEDADAVLVTREDIGGAKAPSENAVLTVPL